MQTDQIGQLLEQLGQALSEGNLHQAANCWKVPALVLSDDGATVVSASSEVEEFFSQAAEWYHLQGIASTKPEIERIDMLSEKLAAVDVHGHRLHRAMRNQANGRITSCSSQKTAGSTSGSRWHGQRDVRQTAHRADHPPARRFAIPHPGITGWPTKSPLATAGTAALFSFGSS